MKIRRDSLKDINSLLINSSINCTSMVASGVLDAEKESKERPLWVHWVLQLLTDVRLNNVRIKSKQRATIPDIANHWRGRARARKILKLRRAKEAKDVKKASMITTDNVGSKEAIVESEVFMLCMNIPALLTFFFL